MYVIGGLRARLHYHLHYGDNRFKIVGFKEQKIFFLHF